MTKKAEKEAWIRQWIEANGPTNIFDNPFVGAFAKKFNARIEVRSSNQIFCPSLGRLLSSMYKSNILNRGRLGLCAGIGKYPTWLYSYYVQKVING